MGYVPDTVGRAAPNEADARAAALETLQYLGAEFNLRRRQCRVPIAALAKCALTTRQTVARVERGDPGVAVGTWASVVTALELNSQLCALAAPGVRPGALRLSLDLRNRLYPKRVRRRTCEQ